MLLLSSCVSKKQYATALSTQRDLEIQLERVNSDLKQCLDDSQKLNSTIGMRDQTLGVKDREIASLEGQLKDQKTTNSQLLERMSDLSVISKTGAESIQKSLESMGQQSVYIKELTGKIRANDSINLALVVNLKRSLDDINDEDVDVTVKGSVVYVSLSDKMLYQSGSANLTTRAQEILGKVAKIVNDQPELNVMVEGHTDNVPINTSCVKDNWDLSVDRATAVVRVLQQRYNVAPSRLIASGRSEYVPKADNKTDANRSTNRRTEIIILPSLDQFFKLNELNEPFDMNKKN